MKNTATINIGLTDTGGKPVTIQETIQALHTEGFTLAGNPQIACGTWQGKPEFTFVCRVMFCVPLDRAESRRPCQLGLQLVAQRLGQECVAIRWPDNRGELIPPCYEFNPSLFHDISLA